MHVGCGSRTSGTLSSVLESVVNSGKPLVTSGREGLKRKKE